MGFAIVLTMAGGSKFVLTSPIVAGCTKPVISATTGPFLRESLSLTEVPLKLTPVSFADSIGSA